MTNSQEWWPADYGHYGPFFIRMAWHSAGASGVADGRGGGGAGTRRFCTTQQLARRMSISTRLVCCCSPSKQKYGKKIVLGRLLIVFTEKLRPGIDGIENFRFWWWSCRCFGNPTKIFIRGSEGKSLDDKRYSGDRELENPLAAVQMGLILREIRKGLTEIPIPLASAVTFGKLLPVSWR